MAHAAAGFRLSALLLVTLITLIALLTPQLASARGPYPFEAVDDGPDLPNFSEISFDFELLGSLSYIFFTEADMHGTYGGLPILGIEPSIRFSDHARFFISLGHGRRSGDPFYDTPEFDGNVEIDLKATLLLTGLRANISQHPQMPVYIGVALATAWTEESYPRSIFANGTELWKHNDIGTGISMSLNPQWCSREGRLRAGLEFGLVSVDADGGGNGYHHVNLDGMLVRITLGMEI